MGKVLSHQVMVQVRQQQQPPGASGPSLGPQSLHFTVSKRARNVLRDKHDLEKSFLFRGCSFLSEGGFLERVDS